MRTVSVPADDTLALVTNVARASARLMRRPAALVLSAAFLLSSMGTPGDRCVAHGHAAASPSAASTAADHGGHDGIPAGHESPTAPCDSAPDDACLSMAACAVPVFHAGVIAVDAAVVATAPVSPTDRTLPPSRVRGVEIPPPRA